MTNSPKMPLLRLLFLPLRLAAAAMILLALAAAAISLAVRFYLPGHAMRGGEFINDSLAVYLPGARAEIGDINLRIARGGIYLRVADIAVIDQNNEAILRADSARARISRLPESFAELKSLIQSPDSAKMESLWREGFAVELINPQIFIRKGKDGAISGIAPLPLGESPPIRDARALLKNARIIFRDDSENLPPLDIGGLEIAAIWKDGAIQFRASGESNSLANAMTVIAVADADGRKGRFYVSADEVSSALGLVLAKWRNLSAQIWGEFGDDKSNATIRATSSKFNYEGGGESPSLLAENISANADISFINGFALDDINFAFDADNLTLTAPAWFAESLTAIRAQAAGEWNRSNDDSNLSVSHADAHNKDLPAQIRGEFGDEKSNATIRTTLTKFNYEGGGESPSLLAENISANADISFINGFALDNMNFAFDADNPTLTAPTWFAESLTAIRAQAAGEWNRSNDDWDLSVFHADAHNKDLSARMAGTIAGSKSGDSILDIQGGISNANAESIGRYLPFALSKETREWLGNAVVGGKLSEWEFRVEGNPQNIPFTEGGGVFFIGGDFEDLTLEYALGEWPPLENASGRIAFENTSLAFEGGGGTAGLTVARVAGSIPNLSADELRLTLDVESAARSEDYFAAMPLFPAAREIADEIAAAGFSARGTASLSLSLDLPMDNPDDARYLIFYRPQKNRISVAGGGGVILFNDASGEIQFDGDNAIGQARANFLGESAVISISLAPSHREVLINGRINVADAADLLGVKSLSDWSFGESDYTLSWREEELKTAIIIETAMEGVAVNLPPPLGKASEEKAALKINWTPDAAADINYKDGLAQAKLFSSENWRGAIGINAPPPIDSGEKGIIVAGKLNNADLDEWLALGEGGGGGIRRAAITATDSILFGISHEVLSLDISSNEEEEAIITVESDAAAGRMIWNGERISAHFSHINVPERNEKSESELESSSQGNSLFPFPPINLTADKFFYRGWDLGELKIAGAPESGGWRIHNFSLTEGGNALAAKGFIDDENSAMVSLSLKANDAVRFFDNLGYPETLASGSFDLSGQIAWGGGIADWRPMTLSGNLNLICREVRYLKTDPGTSKLLALFSPQSLFSLGFADALKEGVEFGEISAQIEIANGVARTRDMRLESREAVVSMTGLADITDEHYNIRGRVRPGQASIGLITLATGLSGITPPLAATTWVLGKIFEKPISEIGAYDFTITGPWSNPVYAEVGALSKDTLGGGGGEER